MAAEDFPVYCAEVRRLRELYAGSLEIYLGLEIDFISAGFGFGPGLSWPRGGASVRDLGLDFYIASLHLFPGGPRGYREVDYSREEYEAIRDETFGGDMRAFVSGYFEAIRDMALRVRPPVVGHLDLIKKNNTGEMYFRESEVWYRDIVRDTVPALAESGSIVEVNTGGLARGRTSSVYPSPWIIEMLCEARVPLMLNSDAHAPENLDAFFGEAREVIRSAGCRELWVFRGGGWEAVGIG
jgi:histidinol-phosphatase (PHP family)